MFSNSGVNKVLLMGEVGNVPFSDKIENHLTYLCINLVTNELINRVNTTVEFKECHNLCIPQKLINQLAITLQPGQIIYVEGKIHNTNHMDDQQIERYNTEILVGKIEIIGYKKIMI